MTTILRRSAAKGFTLIELLIVVIIIAILAAIAIPQFSNTSGDAQESAAIANLTTMRSAVELYRVQHNNTYPSKFAATGTAPECKGTAGAGKDGETGTFTEQMTMFTDLTGHACSTADPGYSYGPYMRAIPVEPVTNSADVAIATSDTDKLADATTTKGWRFVNLNGKLQINSDKVMRDGKTKLSEK
ncbi:prepilin-type N-terminal cleavage/methylation domain-containing protein [Massilia aerilata]|uniref:Prepilin-type N-terminal cleavage/methylation domain-containing protein n=1 Tax=Massilia aerilata TaxID=453817 RepID=A0ABW0S732_9BURK